MKLLFKACFAWLSMVFLLAGMCLVSAPALSFAVTIGEQYGGGIVFYVDRTGRHGLIAAKADIPGFFDWASAKRECEQSMEGGYEDWFLPNKAQLNQLYLHKDAVGGIKSKAYWSSDGIDAADAASEGYLGPENKPDTNRPYWDNDNKRLCCRVRAVRAF